jgi:tetratricopeptide (TPR) repeat protein
MKQYTKVQLESINYNFKQGQQAIYRGRFDSAEKHYLDILKVDADILEAQNALAFVYTFSKQHAKAVVQLNNIIKSVPNDANAHHNLANNLYEIEHNDEAIEHYQKAIELNPNLIDSYTQCGMVYRKLMQYGFALQYLNQAFSLNNTNPKILYGLGLTYAELEDYPRALEFVAKAVKLAPDNSEYNLALAQVLEGADIAHEADVQYHHTCRTFPDCLDAFLRYGQLLYKYRYYDEALECFQRAQALSPNQPDVNENIANVYLGLMDVDRAINQFQQALTKEPNRLSALMGIGQAYQESGNEAEALKLCDHIVALFPDKPNGYTLKSRVLKSKVGDGLADQLVKLTGMASLTDAERVELNFALGKVYDDQKNYAAAFKFYAAANALKNKDSTYDTVATEAEFNAVIDYFNDDFFKQHQHLGGASELPIFIVGMPRSGTTLTEQIISSHPKVMGAGEVVFWGPLTRGLHKMLNTTLSYPQCINEFESRHVQDIVGRYELSLRKITGADQKIAHITDKMPHNFLALGLIALLFPKVKIIHTKRDPIDTCLSIFFQNFNEFHSYGVELERLGRYYRYYEKVMQHWHSVLPGRIMDIHYADTIADPEYWSRQLISHVGLDWDEACLAPHKQERSVKTASHWQVRQPIYKTSVERWRNYEEFLTPLIQALKG